ncbi:MAG: GrpB family protein [Euryarchaeota archaeon]|nr:GrpB family protein [Euryarchaeota archaeon]
MVATETPGEKLDMVELSDHDPRWKDMFQEERALIDQALGPMAMSVEHVGSTSVPGIRAKPVIDILVTVRRLRLEDLERAMEGMGYVHVPIGDEERLFFRKGMPRTHHVHVVRHGGEEHRKHVLFRDRLIDHPDEANEYEELKEGLAVLHREDRRAYCDGKDLFIAKILERADRDRRLSS